MRIGIIDLGTNTLRLDIFETEDKNFKIVYDNAIFSRIVENTAGASLSQDGIEHLIQSIEEHQAACSHYRCDRVECFATASLRYIDNAAAVLEQIEFRTGVGVRMISGEEEASFDYRALMSVSPAESGLGCDLGGGSIQVFTFGKSGPEKSGSFPLGSSREAKAHVSGAIPTMDEIDAIKSDIKNALADSGFLPSGGELFAMGGTAKAAKKLYSKVFCRDGAISLFELNGMLKFIAEQPEEALDLFNDVEPKRANTLAPGMAVLAGLMEYMGCVGMNVFSVGVREGFLLSILEDGGGESGDLLSFILGGIK